MKWGGGRNVHPALHEGKETVKLAKEVRDCQFVMRGRKGCMSPEKLEAKGHDKTTHQFTAPKAAMHPDEHPILPLMTWYCDSEIWGRQLIEYSDTGLFHGLC